MPTYQIRDEDSGLCLVEGSSGKAALERYLVNKIAYETGRAQYESFETEGGKYVHSFYLGAPVEWSLNGTCKALVRGRTFSAVEA